MNGITTAINILPQELIRGKLLKNGNKESDQFVCFMGKCFIYWIVLWKSVFSLLRFRIEIVGGIWSLDHSHVIIKVV